MEQWTWILYFLLGNWYTWPFLAAIVFMGVYPKPVLDRIEPSIDKLISHVEDHTDYVEPEPTIQIGVVPEAPADGEHGDVEEGE